MPKTKANEATQAPTGQEATKQKETKASASIVDLASLTPAQLSELQKQLTQRKKVESGNRKEREEVIRAMCSEINEETGDFANTTRDIVKVLAGAGLCSVLTSEDQVDHEDYQDEVQKEIRKVQAKKQQLEKRTDEKGKLVYPSGTFGYAKGAVAGSQHLSASKIKPATVVGFFEAGRAAELTDKEIASIKAALK